MFCRLASGSRMPHRGSKQNATQSLCIQNMSVHWEGRDLESCHCFGHGGSGKQDLKMFIADELFPVQQQILEQQNKWIKLTLHCQRKSQGVLK